MASHADQTPTDKSNTAQQPLGPQIRHLAASLPDNRQQAVAQRKMQDAINNSGRVQQEGVSQAMIDGSPRMQHASTQQPTTSQVQQLMRFQGTANENLAGNQFAAPIQRQWDGDISKTAKDAEVLTTLTQMGYAGANLIDWKIRQLRESKDSYSSYEAIASKLKLTLTVSEEATATVSSGGTSLAPPSVESTPTSSTAVERTPTSGAVLEPTSDGSASGESTRVSESFPVPSTRHTEPSTSSTVPVPQAVAKSIASRFMMSVEARALEMAQQRAPAKVDTGRAKIYAPDNNLLTVYRAEKSTRNTLEARRAQGGLSIWQPTSTTVQEAYDRMVSLVTKGVVLDELDFKNALDTYAQSLRAEGQPDNLATARTVQGAFVDDYNYTISIPGIQIFKWAPGGIGERILPGAEIKQHYIVLNAATVAASTVFGFGHITGTQEVSFYSKIPANMIASVQARDFSTERQNFVIP